MSSKIIFDMEIWALAYLTVLDCKGKQYSSGVAPNRCRKPFRTPWLSYFEQIGALEPIKTISFLQVSNHYFPLSIIFPVFSKDQMMGLETETKTF